MADLNDLSQTPTEDLSSVVEPLVDAISELVLLVVTKVIKNVEQVCVNIAEKTQRLVVIATQVASGSDDEELQMEVANALTEVAKSIEKLVVSFQQIIINSNPTTQEAFAAAAKWVGDAINKLCVATDQTSAGKISAAIKEATESATQVRNAASNRDQLVSVAQVNVDRTVRLVKVVNLAAISTADERKKDSLLDGANKVKTGSAALIQAAKVVSEKSYDPSAKTELENKYNFLMQAFNQISEASKVNPQYFGKVAATYEYIKKLIEKARELEDTIVELYNVAKTGSDADFVNLAKIATNQALDLIGKAQDVAKNEKDPVRKVILRNAIDELRDASQNFILAGKQLRLNPNDPTAKKNFGLAKERLEAAIKNVVDTIEGKNLYDTNTPKGKLGTAVHAVETVANNLLANATKKNTAEVLEDAELLKALALKLAEDAKNYANDLPENERKKVMQSVKDVNDAIDRLEKAARKFAQNPTEENFKELKLAQQNLLDKLNQLKKDARLVASDLDFNASESGKLVDAAKEQANAAMELAQEAENLANKITDPIRKQKIKDAVKQLKLAGQKVVEMAELVSRNPGDPSLQAKLNLAQQELSQAIENVVNLTSNANKDLNEAMNDLKNQTNVSNQNSGLEANVLSSAEKVLSEIFRLFGDSKSGKKLTPAEVISGAKELSLKAGELVKQLQELAAKTTDPVYKEKLVNATKILKDGMIQVKILSAVRAAGSDDKTNTVQSCVRTMQTNIQEIVKEVQAESLRTKFKQTVKQTVAINKVITNWRKIAK